MKIYIENYNINKLLSKLKYLKTYQTDSKQVIFIYSNEGFFKIDCFNIMKINILKDKIDKTQMKGFIVDESEMEYEKYTHIPFDHISHKITQLIYKTNSSSKVTFIIEGFYRENNFVPTDFYFETIIKDKIYNPIIKDDLNVFLSLLN